MNYAFLTKGTPAAVIGAAAQMLKDRDMPPASRGA